jgi:hypothetical protein
VPAKRLTKDYFRKWWYWKGVSKARLEQRHPTTELGLDMRKVPRRFGVPRFLIGDALRDACGWVAAAASLNAIERTRREMRLCYAVGYAKGVAGAESENDPAPAIERLPAISR